MTQANKKHVSKYQEIHHKKFPAGTKGVWVDEKTEGKYSLITEEISLPAAVIKQQSLENNLKWMQQFANHHQVKLSPHGKTTMTPAFFEQQLEAGAWGVTVATAPHAQVAAEAGAKNIMMANQLVGKANMAMVKQTIEQYGVNFYCCVDSVANADQLHQYFSQHDVKPNVLIEFGVEGGRCGCRNPEEVVALAKHVSQLDSLNLAGLEVYEGVIHGDNAEDDIRQFLATTVKTVEKLAENKLITEQHPIVTGAGSAWYDVVAESFAACQHLNAIIRPGCYLIHDTGIYQDAQDLVMARAQKNQGYACDLGGNLESALEVWAYVISRPEPNKAVIGLGKRDVAFDAGLPIPERGYRDGAEIAVQGLVATAIMDQHTFVTVPEGSDLAVGDIIAFSTSHPCLTFDKWKYICVADEAHNVHQFVETCF
ncbi:amino acid deaminase [Photobacterium sanctipauli]|uniref:Amino acid deaminase n=1 Tax=Photobacterium sanctipauli TaxID=1342794 RepID=A0A2T3NNP0_9GAMM|nr:amino acid deaminase [Photobacterium sanctipauli]PSW17602.1 amino acid deaminase [Photobacterium sanctipauli]